LAFAAELLVVEGDTRLKNLLEKVLRTPPADSVRQPPVLAEWAPRVAAVSACVTSIATQASNATLRPVREAHRMILPVFNDPRTSLDLRIRIAEGFGAITDPRLTRRERWVQIPAGTSLRGSEAEDSWIQEHPQVEIELAEFWIQRWPVTVDEYGEFVEG